jgi:hypothetical protein
VKHPQHAGDLFRQLVRQTGRQMRRSDFVRALDQVLTDGHRPHCQVVSFRDGKLLLEVDSAPLFAELSGFRRDEIRTRLNAILANTKVAQLSFRLGGTGHV